MENQFSPKYIIISLIVVVLALIGILFWQYQQKPIPLQEETSSPVSGGQIIHKPWAETAERYYPGGGNAIDFRDGAQGNFEIEIAKTGDTVKVTWPSNIKAVEVKVYDIGTLSNLQDHRVVFDIVNWDINNPPEVFSTSTPEVLLQPEVYLSSSYKIGEIPSGFFESPFAEKEEEIFKNGNRYSIEILGVASDGSFTEAYYTFNYEG